MKWADRRQVSRLFRSVGQLFPIPNPEPGSQEHHECDANRCVSRPKQAGNELLKPSGFACRPGLGVDVSQSPPNTLLEAWWQQR